MQYTYLINTNFMIEQWLEDVTVPGSKVLGQVINADDSLYVEDPTTASDRPQAVALSFWQNSQTLYGLPEREDTTIILGNTDGLPYELFSIDVPDHWPDRRNPMYGSIPYIMGL